RPLQVLQQLLGYTAGETEKVSPRTAAVLLDRTQHFLFELRSHTRECPKLLLAAEAFQIIDGVNFEVLEQDGDALGSEPLNLQKLEGAGGIFLEKLIAFIEGSALKDLRDNCGDSFADSGDVG